MLITIKYRDGLVVNMTRPGDRAITCEDLQQLMQVSKCLPMSSIKGSVVYEGTSDAQVQWGGNDDPRGVLTEGTLYDVIDIEVHSWHTKLTLAGFEGKQFNSACFKWADETPLNEATAAWRRR